MHILSGHEDLVDPPVARRPLPFSRAWMAAFVLAVIAVGWVAAVNRFDAQGIVSDVDSLAKMIDDFDELTAGEDSRLIASDLEEVSALAAGARTGGDPRLARAWGQVSSVTEQARTADLADPRVFGVITADLRAAFDELDALSLEYQNRVSSADSISLSPS
jgi:hypothetical protein